MPGRHQESAPRLGVLLLSIVAVAVVVVAILWLRPEPTGSTTTTTMTITATAPTVASVPTTSSTTPPTTRAASTTTTLGDPLAALILDGDGIGEIALGSDADLTVDQLTAVLGSPDEDTGWTTTLGTCPGTEARIVRWSSLQIYLTDGETAWATGQHFFHYGQSLAAGGGEYLDLRTDKSVGIGSTIGELKAAYAAAATVSDDPAFGPYWEVVGNEPSYLWGTASGVTDDAVIDALNGGAGCGE